MITNKIHAENTTATDAIKDYINLKLNNLSRFEEVDEKVAKVSIKVYPDKNTKITVTIDKFHAEEKHRDLYAAIDLVIEKLDKQLRKAKTKRINFRQNRTPLKHLTIDTLDDYNEDDE